jgi:hypothetical protein
VVTLPYTGLELANHQAT